MSHVLMVVHFFGVESALKDQALLFQFIKFRGVLLLGVQAVGTLLLASSWSEIVV